MRALLQRVTCASVEVNETVVGSINSGLVIFIGVAANDTSSDAEFIVNKSTNLRIFSDKQGKFNLSALDVGAELLIVSQFTLMADTLKGRRPSFIEAAPPDFAEKLFNQAVEMYRNTGLNVQTGLFQQHMLVKICNDGPVTIMLDSKSAVKKLT